MCCALQHAGRNCGDHAAQRRHRARRSGAVGGPGARGVHSPAQLHIDPHLAAAEGGKAGPPASQLGTWRRPRLGSRGCCRRAEMRGPATPHQSGSPPLPAGCQVQVLSTVPSGAGQAGGGLAVVQQRHAAQADAQPGWVEQHAGSAAAREQTWSGARPGAKQQMAAGQARWKQGPACPAIRRSRSQQPTTASSSSGSGSGGSSGAGRPHPRATTMGCDTSGLQRPTAARMPPLEATASAARRAAASLSAPDTSTSIRQRVPRASLATAGSAGEPAGRTASVSRDPSRT